MAGKVLPGSKFDTGSGASGSGMESRQLTLDDTRAGREIAADPYDSPSEGSAYVRDVLAEDTAADTVVPDEKEKSPEPQAGREVEAGPESSREAARGRSAGPGLLSWEDELAAHPGDPQKAYRLHMAGLAAEFKRDLIERAENTMTELAEQSRTAYAIEKERKDTIDYAMAAYGQDADLKGISGRAMAAQQTNAKELTGPLAGLSFRINQGLSGGRDSMVRLPNGRQVEMDSQVAALLSVPEAEKGGAMAGMFMDYAKEKDPGFAEAMEAMGGTAALAGSRDLMLTKKESRKLELMWSGVVSAQEETAAFEAKPTDRLTPKEYEALGLDPSEARSRRMSEYGDPSAYLGIVYSHPREHNGRPLPEPMIMSYGHGGMQHDGPDRG